MVFERRTDVGRMLFRLETTSFDVVSCVWLDFDPWRGICRGVRRFEGTLDIEDGVLVHRLGATRGEIDGLPVYDVVHQFFVASVERLGPAPWDADLNLSEHYELFLSLKERGLLCTRLPDVFVQHRQALPPAYQGIREDTGRYVSLWHANVGFVGVARRARSSARVTACATAFPAPPPSPFAASRASAVGCSGRSGFALRHSRTRTHPGHGPQA